jgi:glycosyltransferase involved in cell wall biosynthesis
VRLDPSTRSLAILGTRGIPARYGGFETFADEVSTRLAAQGISVAVFCESDDPATPKPSTYRGVDLVYVPVPELGPLSTIVHDLRCLWRARSAYDVVYMLGYGAALFCWLPRLFGTEVWINMDGIEWRRTKYGRLGRLWLRLMEAVAVRTPTRIVADADAVEASLRRRHRRLPACSVIPYGAPNRAEEPSDAPVRALGLQPGRYHLVVCRFEPENHVREIIEGYTASRSQRPLVVLGTARAETPYVRDLRRLAAADERVHMLPPIYDPERLTALRYHACSYLHGHSVGGTNPSLVEALGCGNAVLAHDNPFNREVAGRGALYFTDAADVPDLVERLEADAQLRTQLGREARQRQRECYTWDAVVADYLALLGVEPAPDAVSSGSSAARVPSAG